MRLEVENVKINQVIDLLDRLSLRGLKSIHRTRLSQQLTEKLQRVVKEEKEIRKDLCHLDENGKPKIKEDGNLDVKNITEFNKIMAEFYKEKIIISGDEPQIMLKSVKDSLETTEMDFEGESAYTFEHLYSGFVGGAENESEEVVGE